MKSKVLSKIIFLIIVLAGYSLFLAGFLDFIRPIRVLRVGLVSDNEAAQIVEKKENYFGLPLRLKIPAIGVDSSVDHVGVNAKGEMDVPDGPNDVAWFNLGPRPGESGSAVISGHYGWKNGIAAVFDDLYKLQKGDRLYVEDSMGGTSVFIVRELRRYDENENAADVFNSDDGISHLNLVTCEGIWNKLSKSYSKRLVVFTDNEFAGAPLPQK